MVFNRLQTFRTKSRHYQTTGNSPEACRCRYSFHVVQVSWSSSSLRLWFTLKHVISADGMKCVHYCWTFTKAPAHKTLFFTTGIYSRSQGCKSSSSAFYDADWGGSLPWLIHSYTEGKPAVVIQIHGPYKDMEISIHWVFCWFKLFLQHNQ